MSKVTGSFDDVTLGQLFDRLKVNFSLLACHRCDKSAAVITNGIQNASDPTVCSWCEECFVAHDFNDMITSQVEPSRHIMYRISDGEEYQPMHLWAILKNNIKDKEEKEKTKRKDDEMEMRKLMWDTINSTYFTEFFPHKNEKLNKCIDLIQNTDDLDECKRLRDGIYQHIKSDYGKNAEELITASRTYSQRVEEISKYGCYVQLDLRYGSLITELRNMNGEDINFLDEQSFIEYYSKPLPARWGEIINTLNDLPRS
jgi:hypothetical protein